MVENIRQLENSPLRASTLRSSQLHDQTLAPIDDNLVNHLVDRFFYQQLLSSGGGDHRIGSLLHEFNQVSINDDLLTLKPCHFNHVHPFTFKLEYRAACLIRSPAIHKRGCAEAATQRKKCGRSQRETARGLRSTSSDLLFHPRTDRPP